MSNRFEAMTDDDFDHSLGMYRAALARRGAEAKGWKRLAFDLIRAAGGMQRISMSTALAAHTDDTLEAHQEPDSGNMGVSGVPSYSEPGFSRLTKIHKPKE